MQISIIRIGDKIHKVEVDENATIHDAINKLPEDVRKTLFTPDGEPVYDYSIGKRVYDGNARVLDLELEARKEKGNDI